MKPSGGGTHTEWLIEFLWRLTFNDTEIQDNMHEKMGMWNS